ncbi:Uncharacterised protein [Niallia circulans]|jgi:hypothetical protein|uniref:hypothetical protein n=1 Tax=Niallia TaxID=2837506 RepID=UPI000A5BA92F|nr:hypothetical protein [Niallia circulans]MED3837715.1 hypothetical protein [Niallia circulans]MED4243139.1 hypothetical protein [Niallia circulans]MED4247118.1 hypothetical protein [Niallia circulans]MED5099591.1 hypothetical protein [Niallia circulans]SPU10942.1 Uncharacterised protein [Niallia circulans]
MVKKNNNSIRNEERLRSWGFSKTFNRINNDNESFNTIKSSGNSDVDLAVEVNIDTTAIGFAILCSLLATGQMTDIEFQKAVKTLEKLTKEKMGNFYGNSVNDVANAKLYNLKRL